ncbi:hypothetical protein AcV5_000757 [Taiwanofungus camphoratus]|nr:hypothetical protein AcV5_000757 [Antrodia cinnamomea]
MKLTTKEEQDAQMRATVAGGLKGLAGGLALALPGAYLLNQRWAYYRALPRNLKAFGIVVVAVPSFIIPAEHAGMRFEKLRWTGVGKQELDTQEARERARWEALTPMQKLKDTAARHEYGLIGGAWAASMVGAFGWIMRDPYQTFPQKIVQARMWAQGLTIGILIAAGALTHAKRHKEVNERGVRHIESDHSWRDIVEAEVREEKARKQGAPGAPPGKAV